MASRIYSVKGGGKVWMVNAATAAGAIRAIVGKQYEAKAATPKDVAEFMSHGGKILDLDEVIQDESAEQATV